MVSRLLLICLSTLAVSCGSRSRLESACAREAAARCAKAQDCSGGLELTVSYASRESCEAGWSERCLSYAQAPGTSRTPALIDACAAALEAQSCDAYSQPNPRAAACGYPAGTRPIGAGCFSQDQCASGNCAYENGCRRCAQALQVGDACSGTGRCAGNVFCDGAVCYTPATQEGAACDENHVCLGMWCIAGHCQAMPRTLGAACDPTSVTAPPLCELRLGLICDKGRCAAGKAVEYGEACGGLAFCAHATNCATSPSAPSTCVLAGKEGASCSAYVAGLGSQCEYPLNCYVPDTSQPGTCRGQDVECPAQ